MRTTRVIFGIAALVSGVVILVVELLSPSPWVFDT